tara:strand:- start:17 stop:214 length:198 start_codon:yes stop_codon:yes gene_type:complete
MYNIFYNLLKSAKGHELHRKIETLSERAKSLIKVKVSKQDIENLINPKDGVYDKDIKNISFDLNS